MNPQSYDIHNFKILGLTLENLKKKRNNFNVVVVERSKIKYMEEGGDLFLNVGCTNVVNPKKSMTQS
jgi:hypothetical protein